MIRKIGNNRNIKALYLRRSSTYERRSNTIPLQEIMGASDAVMTVPEETIHLPVREPTPVIMKRDEQLLPGFANQNFL
jgi:hypothetical protein